MKMATTSPVKPNIARFARSSYIGDIGIGGHVGAMAMTGASAYNPITADSAVDDEF